MTEKTFTCAGVSNLNGVLKVRFGKDMLRVKMLARCGHTDIEMFDFAEELEKVELVDKLLAVEFKNAAYANVVKQTAVDKYGFIIDGFAAKKKAAKKVDETAATVQAGGAVVVWGGVQNVAAMIVPQRIKGRFAKRDVREAAMNMVMA